MSGSLLDKSLDEIIGDSRSSKPLRGSRGGHRRGGSHRGVSKSFRSRRGGYRSSHGDSYVPPVINREIEELSNGKPYLRITNLNYELTEQDIHQLFSQVGEVSFCRIEFDTQGNSKGIAYIGYVDPINNDLATDKFDGRRAAGQVITVKDVSKPRAPNPLFERISSTSTRERKSARHPKKKTAEELDAELDSYFQSTEDNVKEQEGDPNPPFPAV